MKFPRQMAALGARAHQLGAFIWSEGLLLFTNDSEWAARVTAPESHLDKIYHAQIGTVPDAVLLQTLERGVMSKEGESLRAKRVRPIRSGGKNSWIELVLDEGKNRQIRRMLDAYPDVGLVILDTLTRYWVNKIDDENSNTQVARVTAPLLEITRERGVTLLMIHHDRKNIESQGSPRNIRGAGDLFGVVDQAWLLSPGIGTQRKLRIVGRYQDQSPLMLTIALGDDDYQRVRVEGEAAGRQDAVWDVQVRHGGSPRDAKAADPKKPYVMWPGSPYEHLMLPTK
jgi:pseudouridine synthase